MISLLKCKQILEKNSETYTDEMVKEIRDFLWPLAQAEAEAIINQIEKSNEKSSDNGQGELG
jgi:hypothetical protein